MSPTQLKSLKETARNHFGQTTESPDWNPDADLNGDGRVDIRDKRVVRDATLAYKRLVRENFGKRESDPDWNPDADLNGNGRVDIRDKRILRDLFL